MKLNLDLVLDLLKGSFGMKHTDRPFSHQPINFMPEETLNADIALTNVIHTINSISAC